MQSLASQRYQGYNKTVETGYCKLGNFEFCTFLLVSNKNILSNFQTSTHEKLQYLSLNLRRTETKSFFCDRYKLGLQGSTQLGGVQAL